MGEINLDELQILLLAYNVTQAECKHMDSKHISLSFLIKLRFLLHNGDVFHSRVKRHTSQEIE